MDGGSSCVSRRTLSPSATSYSCDIPNTIMTRKNITNQNHNHQNCSDGEDSPDQNEIEEKKEKRKRPPVVGLVNLGNTCFMNAVLQCLSRSPNLFDKLVTLLKNPLMTYNGFTLSSSPEENVVNNELKLTLHIPQDSMTFKMTELLSKITSGGSSPINPGAVHSVMCSSEFTAGMQHDSHELLRSIVDRMKREQVKAIRRALLDSVGVSTKDAAALEGKDPQKAEELKKLDKKLHQNNIMDQLFGGELMTTRTCLVCNSVKISREEFLDLSLPIREEQPNYSNNPRSFHSNEAVNHSLMECLQRFTAPEMLIESNLVDCEKCHENNLELIKSGVPVEKVFPIQPKPSPSRQETKNSLRKEKGKYKRNNSHNNKQQPPTPPPLPQQSLNQQFNRRRRKKKTRADKIANDQIAEWAAAAATTQPFDDFEEGNVKDEDSTIQREIPESAQDSKELASIATTPLDDSEEGNAKEEIQESDSQQDSKELIENENEIMSENEKDKYIESSSSDLENMPELEKVPDEGYAEDYKESDDEIPSENGGEKVEGPQLYHDNNINEDDDDEEEEDDVGEEDNVTGEEEEKSDKQEKFEIPKSTKSSSRSQTMITKPPPILTIQLKRFTCGIRGITLKLQDHVTFSEYIDIKEFVKTDNDDITTNGDASHKEIAEMVDTCSQNNIQTNSCHLKSSQIDDDLALNPIHDKLEQGEEEEEGNMMEQMNVDDICDPNGIRYRLYGIVEHSGSLHWGHYVAYTRVDDEWYYISDSYVSQSKLSDVLSRCPYIFFYERVL